MRNFDSIGAPVGFTFAVVLLVLCVVDTARNERRDDGGWSVVRRRYVRAPCPGPFHCRTAVPLPCPGACLPLNATHCACRRLPPEPRVEQCEGGHEVRRCTHEYERCAERSCASPSGGACSERRTRWLGPCRMSCQCKRGYVRLWDRADPPRGSGGKAPPCVKVDSCTTTFNCTAATAGNMTLVPCGQPVGGRCNTRYRRQPTADCSAEEKAAGQKCDCAWPNKLLPPTEGGHCVPRRHCHRPPNCGDPATEVYKRCAPPPRCRPTCRQHIGIPAGCRRRRCAPACVCRWNYVRDGQSGRCVKPHMCPAEQAGERCSGSTKCPGCTGDYVDPRGCTVCRHCPWPIPAPTCRALYCVFTPADDIECGDNTEPVPCGTFKLQNVDIKCSDSADDWVRSIPHTCTAAEHRAGARCGCKLPNRIDEGGSCVPAEQCNMCDRLTEVHSRCASRCQPSCQQPEGLGRCLWPCEVGCVCREGYLRDHVSGKCVPKDLCPGHDDEKCPGLTKCPGCAGTYTDGRGCTVCRHCPWPLPVCMASFCGYTPTEDITCADGRVPVPCGAGVDVDRKCEAPTQYPRHNRPQQQTTTDVTAVTRDLCTPAEQRAGVRCGCPPTRRMIAGECVSMRVCLRLRLAVRRRKLGRWPLTTVAPTPAPISFIAERPTTPRGIEPNNDGDCSVGFRRQLCSPFDCFRLADCPTAGGPAEPGMEAPCASMCPLPQYVCACAAPHYMIDHDGSCVPTELCGRLG